MSVAWCLNTAWMLSCRRDWRRFVSAARAPAQTQAAVLQTILANNRDTEWGRKHGFGSIRTPGEFRSRVPITTYADYETAIDRIAAGEENILTAKRVLLFEPTSGTSSARKLIPYTASLRSEFQRMIGAWIYDLFRNRPRVRSGRAYWSISPAFGTRELTSGGIPIGFEDDREYLGGWQRRLAGRVLAVPSDVARATDIETFRFQTLLQLLRCRDLSLISIWSPTFLTALLNGLKDSTDLLAELSRIDGKRAAEVRTILQSREPRSLQVARLWPQLALISCWADASAEAFAHALDDDVGAIERQPKGLLATEGCVSFPMCDQPGAALALTSHFLEFEALDERDEPTGEVCLAHELDAGRRYNVLLTTGGGLYRYRLGDTIEVVGEYEACPLVRFRGRTGSVSDLVGEKLSEQQVRAALSKVLPQFGAEASETMIIPVGSQPPRYRLLIPGNADDAGSLAADLQAELERNPHYRYAVELGQLAPLDVEWLAPAGESVWQRYERFKVTCGQKLGDIKPTSLAVGPPWPESHPTSAATARG